MAYEIEITIFGAAVGLVTPISIYIAKKIIEPTFKLRELISNIVYSLTYYADIYSNPGATARHQKVSRIFRHLASELVAKSSLIKCPQIPASLGLIPPVANINAASRELIGISNMLFHGSFVTQIAGSSEKVAKLLKL
jgi:hypothetical protein